MSWSWWEIDGATLAPGRGLCDRIPAAEIRPHRITSRSHLHDFTTFRIFEPRSPVALPCADALHGTSLHHRFLASLSTPYATFPPRAPWPCSKALPPALPDSYRNRPHQHRLLSRRCILCDFAHASRTLVIFAHCHCVASTPLLLCAPTKRVASYAFLVDQARSRSLTVRPLRPAARLIIAQSSVRDVLRLLLGRLNKGASSLIVRVTFVQAAQSRSQTTEHLLPPDICPTDALHNLEPSLYQIGLYIGLTHQQLDYHLNHPGPPCRLGD